MAEIKNPCALIVDDEEDICELIRISFESINVDCVLAYSVSDAIIALGKSQFDLCITDLKLPDDSGFLLIDYIQKNFPDIPVAMMTAHGNVESAVEALKRGAFDFISKPFDLMSLRNLALGAIKISKESSNPNTNNKDMLGNSTTMEEVRKLISKFARSQAPVFINGESGTGKELAARAIHKSSARSEGLFVAVNCGAIPEHLMESEFFGHKKGSFTGADKDKTGLFKAAENGTLFLDEVADLPQSMQVKLLRAIQERAIRPVGASEEQNINVRIVSATHKNLEAMVEKGEFRQDLFYRLNVISLKLPPLRERLSDLSQLCVYILTKINKANNSNIKITASAIEALKKYQFPGNVRELENILERAVVLCEEDNIKPDDLNLPQIGTDLTANISNNESKSSFMTELESLDLEESVSITLSNSQMDKWEFVLPNNIDDLELFLAEVERKVLIRTLTESSQNKTQAAEKLNISFRMMRYKLKKLGID